MKKPVKRKMMLSTLLPKTWNMASVLHLLPWMMVTTILRVLKSLPRNSTPFPRKESLMHKDTGGQAVKTILQSRMPTLPRMMMNTMKLLSLPCKQMKLFDMPELLENFIQL